MLEGLQGVGGAFNEKKISEVRNSVFYFHFPSYEKLAITTQFDLNRFHDVIIRNS